MTIPALLPHHARELFEGSGIDPAVAIARGYRSVTAAEAAALGFADYQCGDGLLLPQWTLAGVQRGHKLKRDMPRTDARGKTVKYEFPAGSPPAFDVHPDVRHRLRDLEATLYLTEGIKKADAGVSRGALFVDVGSVWMFLNGRLVVPDLDEIPLDDRLVRVVYDSDILAKPSVAEAMQRLCAALHRRGARVEVVFLPQGADAAKIGIDDFFVGGGTVADLDALARPWTGEGPGVWLRGAGETDADELIRQRDAARDDTRALVRAILNPEISRQELVAVTSATTQALAKQRRGEGESNGRVVLSSAEIADDWRPAPAKGERIAPTNPSGDRPRLARERVKPILAPAVERGLLAARPRPVRRTHANGSTYLDTEWVFDSIPSIAAALSPWGAYRPAEPTVRKPRTTAAPCPECREVHPIHRRDSCTGCGAIVSEKTIVPAPATASDGLSEAQTTGRRTPPAAPRTVVRWFIGGGSPPEEPAWLAAAPDPADDGTATVDAGKAPPPLAAARVPLAAADRAPDRDLLRRATDDLRADLEPIARERGRAPVPKPSPSSAFLPHAPGEAGADRWTL